jgi:hypothetical protein
MNLRKLIYKFIPIIDFLVSPITAVTISWHRLIRWFGISRTPYSRRIYRTLGVFPIINHYYEPKFVFSNKQKDEELGRSLEGINLNTQAQLDLLSKFSYQSELLELSLNDDSTFDFANPNFPPGDSECYYSLIRQLKPKRIIEIGSGHSTLIGIEAIRKNVIENASFECVYNCIEPYEMPWLESLESIILHRSKVEEMRYELFEELDDGDILFIDSSHIVRPNGDVLFEILEILPRVKSGVVVHFHDIFTPNDYPAEWIDQQVKFWNEQYFLEAFLTCNDQFEILLGLNYLNHNYKAKMCEVFPIYNKVSKFAEPGSFWIRKR